MAEKYRILVVNPGSTSTKAAVFENDEKVFAKSIVHTDEELSAFSGVMDQCAFRTEAVKNALDEAGYDLKSFHCIMSRGGMIPPCESGAYTVNDDMLAYMYDMEGDVHISNVGCAVARALAEIAGTGIPCCIYDPVTVDELEPIARITGLPEVKKASRGHALNTRAMARRCAAEVMHKPLEECTFIVQHIGGGVSCWLIHHGRSIDMNSDDDAGFAPERCGKIQAMSMVKLCCNGEAATYKQMAKKVRGNAGMRALLGTGDLIAIEKRIEGGDEYAKLVYEAFAYGTAKGISELAAAVCGKVDRIIITGGAANSKMLTDMIRQRVEWICPVEIMPGEHEMEALAEGGLRILRGEEKPHEFKYNKEH